MKTFTISAAELAGSIADQLGAIKAQIAPLQTKEKALKAQLIETGETAAEGSTFRATVSTSERSGYDAEKVGKLIAQLVADGTISRQKAKSLIKTSEVVTVRVSAQKTSA